METIAVSTTLLFLIGILCPTLLIFLLKSQDPKFFQTRPAEGILSGSDGSG